MAYTYNYPRPAVTVDTVIYHLTEGRLRILLIRRGQDPYAGDWALPGGFMDIDETPEDAAKRELKEETGIEVKTILQVGAFGALGRDPRHRTLSVAYLSLLGNQLPEVSGADDAEDARWFPLDELPENLAFDHHDIVKQAGVQLCMQLRTVEAGTAEAFDLNEEEIQQVLQAIAE